MRRTIRYGDERIGFDIRFVPKPARRISIHVMPDGAVVVDAPEGVSPDDVVDAVRKRASWIWKQLAAQRERRKHILPREYVSGESHFYLGRRHVLKVVRSGDEPSGVRLLRGRLEIVTGATDREVVKNLLSEWYRQRAKEVFAKRLAELAQRLNWLKAPPPFRLRDMRTQWGSCSPRGTLMLNPQLVKAPTACIDYVIVHELCHLKEHNHSARYYRLLHAALPDWERRKSELDEMAELLLNR